MAQEIKINFLLFDFGGPFQNDSFKYRQKIRLTGYKETVVHENASGA